MESGLPSRVSSAIGVLLSGGLDSSILLAHFLRQQRRVAPFYIRTDTVWAEAELAAVRQFLAAVETPDLLPLVIFDLPLADLYQDHWSVSGRDTPGDTTPDEAVYLRGRNALLAIKPLLWCQTHGMAELALGALWGNPFADATPQFLQAFSTTVTTGSGGPLVRLVRPLGELGKAEVLELGRDLPLELTFSCISPVDNLHCGRCNKCGERRAAFRAIGLSDPTRYQAGERGARRQAL